MQKPFWGKAKKPSKIDYAMGLDPLRLKASAAFAYEDFLEGCTFSKKFPLEVLTYYFTTRQISKALSLSRDEIINARVREVYFADIEVPPDATWVTILNFKICELSLLPTDWLSRALELRYYKKKRCKK